MCRQTIVTKCKKRFWQSLLCLLFAAFLSGCKNSRPVSGELTGTAIPTLSPSVTEAPVSPTVTKEPDIGFPTKPPAVITNTPPAALTITPTKSVTEIAEVSKAPTKTPTKEPTKEPDLPSTKSPTATPIPFASITPSVTAVITIPPENPITPTKAPEDNPDKTMTPTPVPDFDRLVAEGFTRTEDFFGKRQIYFLNLFSDATLSTTSSTYRFDYKAEQNPEFIFSIIGEERKSSASFPTELSDDCEEFVFDKEAEGDYAYSFHRGSQMVIGRVYDCKSEAETHRIRVELTFPVSMEVSDEPYFFLQER